MPCNAAASDIRASEHSRIVVARGGLDDVIGVAFKHDLLAALLDAAGNTVADHARPMDAVPWMLRADDLLARFRQRREHLALVVDEYGAVIGVVSLEDVIEVVTGPIVDETDRHPDLRAYARAKGRARLRRRT